jgi:hypothetical protein
MCISDWTHMYYKGSYVVSTLEQCEGTPCNDVNIEKPLGALGNIGEYCEPWGALGTYIFDTNVLSYVHIFIMPKQ